MGSTPTGRTKYGDCSSVIGSGPGCEPGGVKSLASSNLVFHPDWCVAQMCRAPGFYPGSPEFESRYTNKNVSFGTMVFRCAEDSEFSVRIREDTQND